MKNNRLNFIKNSNNSSADKNHYQTRLSELIRVINDVKKSFLVFLLFLIMSLLSPLSFAESDWVFCANQGDQCTVPVESKVRYGGEGLFSTVYDVEGSVRCGAPIFGVPKPGEKNCEYMPTLGGNEIYGGTTISSERGEPTWVGDDFESRFETTPIVIAQMQTANGGNPAGIRMRNVANNSFEVLVEEEQSLDDEIIHSTESVGYLAFEAGIIRDGLGNIIGESGNTSTSQDSLDQWHTVDVGVRQYYNPIIVGAISTYNGTAPVNLQIRNITPTSFEYRIAEWEYLDGGHTNERISFVVIEAGNYILDSGKRLIADTVSADSRSTPKSFPSSEINGFSSAPIVLTQQQGINITNSPRALITRMQNITKDDFDLFIQPEEALDGNPPERDSVGYIAVGDEGGVNNETWAVNTISFNEPASDFQAAEELFFPNSTIPDSIVSNSSSGRYDVINFATSNAERLDNFDNESPFRLTEFYRPQSPDSFVTAAIASISVETTEEYQFAVSSTGGFQLRINGTVVISEPDPSDVIRTTNSEAITLTKDETYNIELIHFHTGNEFAALELYMFKENSHQPTSSHLVTAGLNEFVDDHIVRNSVTYTSNRPEGFDLLRKGDTLASITGDGSFASLTDDGNFILRDANESVIWTANTAAIHKINVWVDSFHHAKQCTDTENNDVCGAGNAVKVDSLGFHVANIDGMIIWRPDLGDIRDTDTSEGFSLQIRNKILQLRNNKTDHIRWNHVNGYQPVKKAVTALFTSSHSGVNWQRPHVPGYGATTTLTDGNDLLDYIPEKSMQRSVLSYHISDNNNDILMCSDCDVDEIDQYELQIGASGLLKVIKYNNNTGEQTEQVWSSGTGDPNRIGAYLMLTNTGMEIIDPSDNNRVIWSIAGLPESNYMLRLAKGDQAIPHLELWDMEANTIAWDSDSVLNAEERRALHESIMPRVLTSTMANAINIGNSHPTIDAKGLNITKLTWNNHLAELTETGAWQTFLGLFNGASHVRVHDSLHSLDKLKEFTEDLEEARMYTTRNILNTFDRFVRFQQEAGINTIEGDVLTELYFAVRDPKSVVDSVEMVVEAMRHAKDKAEYIKEIVDNPIEFSNQLEDIIESQIENGIDGLLFKGEQIVKQILPESILNTATYDHNRSLQENDSDDATCEGTRASLLCKAATSNALISYSINLFDLLKNYENDGTTFRMFNNKNPRISERQDLNSFEFTVTLVPTPILRDANNDDVLDLVKLRLRVETVDTAAFMQVRAAAPALGGSVGVFSSHAWSFPMFAFDKNGDRIELNRDNRTRTYSVTGFAVADFNIKILEALKKLYAPVGAIDFSKLENFAPLREAGRIGSAVLSKLGELGSAIANSNTASAASTALTNLANTLPPVPPSVTTLASGIASNPTVNSIGQELTKGASFLLKGINFIAEKTNLTVVGTTFYRFNYFLNDMNPYLRTGLYVTEIGGTVGMFFLLQTFAPEFDEFLFKMTENPLTVVNTELIASDVASNLVYTGAVAAGRALAGKDQISNIAAYIGGAVGFTVSLDSIAKVVSNNNGLFSYLSGPSNPELFSATNLTSQYQARMRVYVTFGKATDGGVAFDAQVD